MGARVTGVAGEAAMVPSTATVRVTGIAGEAAMVPSGTSVRISQIGIEVLWLAGGGMFAGEPGGGIW